MGLRLLGSRPNPFAGSTTVRFELPSAARVRLAVFDVTGRRVRRLQDGMAIAGPHAVVWDGRDDEGRMLPGGVFFYRLETDVASRSARVVHLE
jgi:flagellar hook assembly protein FlgD